MHTLQLPFVAHCKLYNGFLLVSLCCSKLVKCAIQLLIFCLKSELKLLHLLLEFIIVLNTLLSLQMHALLKVRTCLIDQVFDFWMIFRNLFWYKLSCNFLSFHFLIYSDRQRFWSLEGLYDTIVHSFLIGFTISWLLKLKRKQFVLLLQNCHLLARLGFFGLELTSEIGYSLLIVGDLCKNLRSTSWSIIYELRG